MRGPKGIGQERSPRVRGPMGIGQERSPRVRGPMGIGQERSPRVRDPVGIGRRPSPQVRDPMAFGQEPCYGLWRGFPAVRAVPGGPSPDDPRFGASSAAVAVPGAGSRARCRRRSDFATARAVGPSPRSDLPADGPLEASAGQGLESSCRRLIPSPGGSRPRVARRRGLAAWQATRRRASAGNRRLAPALSARDRSPLAAAICRRV